MLLLQARIPFKANVNYVELYLHWHSLPDTLRFNSETRAAGKWLFSEASIRRWIVHRRREFLSNRRSSSGKSRKLSGEKTVGSFRKLHLHPSSVLVKEKYSAEKKFAYYNANVKIYMG